MKTYVALLGLAILAGPVQAGVEIPVENRDLPEGEVERGVMRLDGDKLSMEAPGQEGAGTMIFRGDRKTVWILDHERKTYFELNEEAVAKMSKRVDSVRQEMEERLATLPPEQRAMVEKMMKDRMPKPAAAAAPALAVTVKSTGERAEVAGRGCSEFAVFNGTEKVTEACISEWKSAPVTKEEFAAFRNMATFFDELTKALQSNPMFAQEMGQSSLLHGYDKMDGFPLKIRHFQNNAVKSETVLLGAERKDFPPSTFEIPAGYTQQALPQ